MNSALHDLFFSSHAKALLMQYRAESEANKQGERLDIEAMITSLFQNHAGWVSVKDACKATGMSEPSARAEMNRQCEAGQLERMQRTSNSKSTMYWRRINEYD